MNRRALHATAPSNRPAENAHTESGHGTGYKANASTIAPLCGMRLAATGCDSGCHARYDEHLPPFDTDAARARIKQSAEDIETAWPTN